MTSNPNPVTEEPLKKTTNLLAQSDLANLARKLMSNPNLKAMATPKRIRTIFNAHTLIDTTESVLVWEHFAFPQYYVQFAEMHKDSAIKWEQLEAVKDEDGKEEIGASIWKITVGGRSTDRVLGFEKEGSELRGLIRFEFGAMDSWFEEDTRIFVHPKDPYKRVDTLYSTRHIRIALKKRLLAETNFSVHLYETSLPQRYYLPLTAVKQEVLRPSSKRTLCPYKGEAQYYDIVLSDEQGGEIVEKDLVWTYHNPNLECAEIKGLVCFYDEAVDVEVDGKLNLQPETHFR